MEPAARGCTAAADAKLLTLRHIFDGYQSLGRTISMSTRLVRVLWGALGSLLISVPLAFSAPVNDDLANAIPLSGFVASAPATTVGAPVKSGGPDHASPTPPVHSVWWTWTAPATGDVTMDTIGSDFDTIIAIYTGSA